VITFKKVNDDYRALTWRANGVKLPMGYRGFRMGRNIIITNRFAILCIINKRNEYQFTKTNDSRDYKFFSEHTPLKIKKIRGRWWVDNLPFYNGLKCDKRGNVLIPEAWPPPNNMFKCRNCSKPYMRDKCSECYESWLDGDGEW
jgi:hypothetical protein